MMEELAFWKVHEDSEGECLGSSDRVLWQLPVTKWLLLCHLEALFLLIKTDV